MTNSAWKQIFIVCLLCISVKGFQLFNILSFYLQFLVIFWILYVLCFQIYSCFQFSYFHYVLLFKLNLLYILEFYTFPFNKTLLIFHVNFDVLYFSTEFLAFHTIIMFCINQLKRKFWNLCTRIFLVKSELTNWKKLICIIFGVPFALSFTPRVLVSLTSYFICNFTLSSSLTYIVDIYFLVYDLLNDTVSSAEYIVSNYIKFSEQYIKYEGHHLIWGNITTFVLKDRGKHENIECRDSDIPAKIQTPHFSNTNQKQYRFRPFDRRYYIVSLLTSHLSCCVYYISYSFST